MTGPLDPDSSHVTWMARALEMAETGALRGEVPVGAVIVRAGRMISEAHNRTIQLGDPTAHAEVLAIRAAAQLLGDWRLTDTTLYVTLEPCAQCAGAIVLGRIPRIVFGAHDPKSGMVGSLSNLVQDPRLNHQADVVSGVLRDDAAAILKKFFRERRT